MRKLIVSALAAGALAGGALAGSALASPDHAKASGKASVELRTDRGSVDRSKVDRHLDHSQSHGDRTSHDR